MFTFANFIGTLAYIRHEWRGTGKLPFILLGLTILIYGGLGTYLFIGGLWFVWELHCNHKRTADLLRELDNAFGIRRH